MKNTNRQPRRRGISMILILALLGILSVTAAALLGVLLSEGRYTHDSIGEAQLRQLLLAGAAIVAADPPDASADGPLQLPVELEGATLHLTAMPAEPGEVVYLLDARLKGRQLRQTLRFEKAADGLRLMEASLQ